MAMFQAFDYKFYLADGRVFILPAALRKVTSNALLEVAENWARRSGFIGKNEEMLALL